jgi:hypothetical protein
MLAALLDTFLSNNGLISASLNWKYFVPFRYQKCSCKQAIA